MTRGLAIALLALSPSACGDEVVAYRTSVTDGFAEDTLPRYAAGGVQLRRVVAFDDGRSWEAEGVDTTAPVDTIVTGIARGDAQIVMVAGDTTLVTEDGLEWQAFADFQGYMRAIAWGDGVFVSVGLSGRRAYSEDGWGWLNQPDPDGDTDYQTVAYGDGRFVAVATDRLATSVDGREWTTTPLSGAKLSAIAYGDGRFVAVGDEGRVLITRDGRTIDHDGAGPSLLDVCFFQGQWVGLTYGTMWASEDAVEWAEFAHRRTIDTLSCSPTALVGAGDGLLLRAHDLVSWEEVGTTDGPMTLIRYTGPGG